MKSSPESKSRPALVLLALGIVFGDIGTSPLYAYETALSVCGSSPEIAVGVASLIIWTLFLVVMVKYGLLVMRASYEGEGGIFSLMAMLRETAALRGRWGALLSGLLVFGAALLFGDGAITPAISVLSAVEGLSTIEPGWSGWVVPLAVAILAILFFAQRAGTGRLGFLFGPVMLAWFSTLAILGLLQILEAPQVLAAFHPLHGIKLLISGHWSPVAIMGAVVLAVTGAEALYADMGHFGRTSILRAWKWVVFPSLISAYLGLTALVLRRPELADNGNLFFYLAPTGGPRELLVLLATAATVIASQALISGVFSLTGQAIALGYLPAVQVRHTSAETRGQIYIPSVNFLLGAVCLLLVISFRHSANLANAYGIAVTGAMAITSIAFFAWFVTVDKKPWWLGVPLLAGLLVLDLSLFLPCLAKIFQGGIVPLALAVAVGGVMLTWRRGRLLVHERMSYGAVTPRELGEKLEKGEFRRVEGSQVFVWLKPVPDHAVASILEEYRRVKVVGEEIVILLMKPGWKLPYSPAHDVRLTAHPGRLWLIEASHGFMVKPDVPQIVAQALDLGKNQPVSRPPLLLPPEETIYVISRELIVSGPGSPWPRWQAELFAFLSRNVSVRGDYLGIPADRLIIYEWTLRL